MKRFFLFLDLAIIIFLFILPHFLFKGKLYISGDDTRLLYVYPFEYIKNVAFFSWHNVSSVGSNAPNQFLLPILIILTFISKFLSRVQLDYFSFSLPLIISFIYWKKFLQLLLKDGKKYKLEAFLGSLFFILSPILIVNQLFIFLSTIWLLPLVPSLSYYFIRFLNERKYTYITKAFIISFIFSAGFFSIPWILGIVFPISFSLLIISFSFSKKQKKNFLSSSIIFSFFIFLSQMFWFLPFIVTYLNSGSSNFGSQVLSKAVADTFSPTVLSTATGTILYPLLNLFHRQIAFDFVWQLRNTYLDFYDKTLYFNLIFPVLLLFGLYDFKRYLDNNYRKVFLIFIISFLLSLYLFTVNIGPLKNIFLFLGHIPGFVMFRNFYDKFALGYVYFYTIILAFALVFISNKFKNNNKKYIIYFFFVLALIINFFPVGNIVNAPLWTTKSVNRNINIPNEYIDTMDFVKRNISSSSTILSIPFGEALYTVIKDDLSNNVYTGASPVKILSGVNDLSGYLSFNYSNAQIIIDRDIKNRDYNDLQKFLYKYNVNYILKTRNIPTEVQNSWLYKKELVNLQDEKFINSITDKKIYVSIKGNYELYSLREKNSLIYSKNTSFQKINSVTFKVNINNIKGKQDLFFNDSFHDGWKLILQKNPEVKACKEVSKNITTIECETSDQFITGNEIQYFLDKKIFQSSHSYFNNFSNKWVIDDDYIKNNYSGKFYKINKDGSIDIQVILYFVPQTYFYIGSLITLISFLSLSLISLNYENKKKN